jgi:hypothetical protein
MAASTVRTVVRSGNHHTDRRRERYRRWVAATTLGELAGFTVPAVVGAAVTAAGLSQALTVLALVAAGLVAGAALLTTIGAAQWLVLRSQVERAGIWVPANALAWVAGLVVVFTAMGLAPGRPALVALAGILGGLGVGFTVALVTGAFLVRLLERPAG